MVLLLFFKHSNNITKIKLLKGFECSVIHGDKS